MAARTIRSKEQVHLGPDAAALVAEGLLRSRPGRKRYLERADPVVVFWASGNLIDPPARTAAAKNRRAGSSASTASGPKHTPATPKPVSVASRPDLPGYPPAAVFLSDTLSQGHSLAASHSLEQINQLAKGCSPAFAIANSYRPFGAIPGFSVFQPLTDGRPTFAPPPALCRGGAGPPVRLAVAEPRRAYRLAPTGAPHPRPAPVRGGRDSPERCGPVTA
jgi:hypothetical protein